MKQTYDAAVIGAGIVGVATAQHLVMRGMRVVLLDRRGVALETSYGNSGVIGASYVLPFGFPALNKVPAILRHRDTSARIHYPSLPKYIAWLLQFYRQSQPEARLHNGRLLWPLVKDAVAEHRALMATTDAEKYMHPHGRTAIYRSEASFAGSLLERRLAEEFGVPFEVMDAAQFGEIEPDVRPIYHRAIRWPSSTRIDDPSALVQAYADRFRRDGGTLLTADVTGLAAVGDAWKLATTQGSIEAQNIVVATGPWAADFLKPFGYRFPLAFKRGYHGHFPALGSAQLAHTLVDVAYGYVLTPMRQGYRVTTGARIVGRDVKPRPDQLNEVLPHARELFPLGERIEAQPGFGNRPCFADSLPVIGQAPRHRGLWFHFGHGHLGLTIAPASSRLLADIMTRQMPFCDPQPYRPERFVS